ncbi:hypothetical protein KQI86_17025 [Clostridium sp. MSJ-11]|uniref:Glycosyltransferase RgtA/B/C/D-like domain-containing protein n=1 Tax=Clostridium mobile TaxID=2841512 RepID=A0ABS6EN02_9CLOT|nr:DUF6056 family protein [Clostridium mobile]MBU5486026.1 hypothetical protein [Clostridium mobile]
MTYISKWKKYVPLILLLLIMLAIHQYIFLYGDDLYYGRDASRGLSYLPEFALKQLNINGRVWVHVLLFGILRYNIYLYRIVNPIVIMLTALLIARVSIGREIKDKNFLIATCCASIFFLLLPIEITHTTIYYAACSLNYLYPITIVILYAYLLYEDYRANMNNYRSKWWILLLAFFAGSSTQQAGMIAIGFTVLISLYFKIFKKNKIQKGIIPYYCAVFIGYALVTYGSIKRMIFEKNVGNEMNLNMTIINLLKTNIFSIPVAIYVLILCVCCIFCLYHYSSNRNKYINNVMIFILSLWTIGYAYVILHRKYSIEVVFSSGSDAVLRFWFITFALVYLISLLYVSVLILLKDDYPFLLFCCINAIGAQVMLIVADPRFAGTYKVMFPSLLLMSIFIVYSCVKFFSSKCNKLLKVSIASIFLILALKVSLTTYNGYKTASYVQEFNLNAIEKYHKSADKSILKLKKTPVTEYGYNVGNWNDMPYFMRQCYKIDKETIIEYYK